ncbi:spore coat CotO family protein [Halobacillus yeomjeoni]|uniref:CotO family spore coat protein n=1 Tax=Halobacillus yeomjeoni TaxID=311194 RepID=UPI001CD3963C|nr:CotO family spore coat protein [Halobacillus yeomjeoni]MCA0983785.1 spore coat CotO family protein [Halobacillus yeomjeoni]
MADKKRIAREPMLYIAQPKFKQAEVHMQTSFRTQRPSSQVSASGDSSLHEKELRIRNQEAHSTENVAVEDKEIINEDTSNTDETKPQNKSSRDRRRRFHELTLEGKVNYFFELSPHVPKMKCEVTTKDESQLRGYVTKYEEGIVHMKVFQRPFEREVPFETIKDIRLIGF